MVSCQPSGKKKTEQPNHHTERYPAGTAPNEQNKGNHQRYKGTTREPHQKEQTRAKEQPNDEHERYQARTHQTEVKLRN